jgi:hypothetical protein
MPEVTRMDTIARPHQSALALWTAASTSSVLLVTTIFYWDLVDLLTVFLAPLLALAIWGAFLLSSIFALTTFLWGYSLSSRARIAPLIIHLLTFLVVHYVPFQPALREVNFWLNYDARMRVVHSVEQRELAADLADGERVVPLPWGSRHLSRGGGDVIVSRSAGRTLVFFYTFRGVTDNFSGFMYRSDDSWPEQDDLGGSYVSVRRLRPNWYWVAAT